MATTLGIIITDAGIAEIVNAEHDGTAPVKLTQVGFGSGQYTPTADQTALHDEIKRVDTIAGGVVGDNILHIQALDGSASDSYTVYEVGVYTESGTLFAVYSQNLPILHKIADAQIMLAIDIVLSGFQPSSVTIGDTDFTLAPATTSNLGVVELATTAEALAGTDDERAMTPAAAKAALDAAIAAAKATLVKLDSDDTDNEPGQHVTFTGGSKITTQRQTSGTILYTSVFTGDTIQTSRKEGNTTKHAKLFNDGAEPGFFTMTGNIYTAKYTAEYITMKDGAGNAVNLDKQTTSGVTGLSMTGGQNKDGNTFLDVTGTINASQYITAPSVLTTGRITAGNELSVTFGGAEILSGDLNLATGEVHTKGVSNPNGDLNLSAKSGSKVEIDSQTTFWDSVELRVDADLSIEDGSITMQNGDISTNDISASILLLTKFLKLGDFGIGAFWTSSNPGAATQTIWSWKLPNGATQINKNWNDLKSALDTLRSAKRTFILMPYSTGTSTLLRPYMPTDTLPDSSTSGYYTYYQFGLVLSVQ